MHNLLSDADHSPKGLASDNDTGPIVGSLRLAKEPKVAFSNSLTLRVRYERAMLHHQTHR